MITFKQFINEKNDSSTPILYNIRASFVPVSPSVFERIFTVAKEEKYLHVHEHKSIDGLKKVGKTRKTVSCFSEWSSDQIFDGAEGLKLDFPAVSVLKGKVSFRTFADNYSEMDKQGRRWINVNDIKNTNLQEKLKVISSEIRSKINSTSDEVLELIRSGTGKEKADLISNYLDVSEEVLTKNKELLRSLFKTEEKESYNELLAYNFKVLETVSLYKSYMRAAPKIFNVSFSSKEEVYEDAKNRGYKLFKDISSMSKYLETQI